MAFLYPTPEDKAELVGFASRQLGFLAEDVALLDATCTALIKDIESIRGFVLGISLSPPTNNSQSQLNSGDTLLPIQYHRGGESHRLGSHSTSGHSVSDPFHDPQTRFRPHEALIRSIFLRLRRGRTALGRLNETYGYGFTVVTLCKCAADPLRRGDVDTPGQAITTGIEATPRGSHVNGASVEDRPPGDETSTQSIRMMYLTFVQVFDALIQWATSIVSVLDGEGAVPSTGIYSIPVHTQNEESRAGSLGGIHALHSGTALPPPSLHAAASTQQTPEEGAGSSSDMTPSGGNASSTSAQRMRTVRVIRYDLHDVSSVFGRLKEMASLLYRHEYTFYDPRLQCRLLLPAYYQALKRTIYDLDVEIERLQNKEASFSGKQGEDVTIAFRPTLSEFRFLRDTLQLYWSFCINEDDLTALNCYRMEYKRCAAEAVEVMNMLKQLPQPPTDEASSGTWVPALEERGALEGGFESFWCLRKRVLELRDSLVKDIGEKNRTHRYLMPTSQQQPSDCSPPAGASRGRGSVAQQTLSLLRSWVQHVNCSAELGEGTYSTRRNSRESVLSSTSPLHESKAVLLGLLERMVEALEVQATRLERSYRGTFYRNAKALWMQRACDVLRYMESVSVVFTRPG